MEESHPEVRVHFRMLHLRGLDLLREEVDIWLGALPGLPETPREAQVSLTGQEILDAEAI